MIDRDDPRVPTRPGAPARRAPPAFHTADRAGTYCGPVLGATCGNCRLNDVRRFQGRRLPDTVGAGRPACSRYKPGTRKGRR